MLKIPICKRTQVKLPTMFTKGIRGFAFYLYLLFGCYCSSVYMHVEEVSASQTSRALEVCHRVVTETVRVLLQLNTRNSFGTDLQTLSGWC